MTPQNPQSTAPVDDDRGGAAPHPGDEDPVPIPPDSPQEPDLAAAATKGAAWLTLVSILAKGSQIVVTLGMAAFLSTHDVGLVTLTTSLLNIVALLQMMGVYDVVARTRSDPLRFSGTVVTMSLVVSGALTVVGLLAADVLATELNAPGSGNLLRLAFLSLPFSAYGGVQNALMSRRLDFRLRAISEGLSSIVGSMLTIALAWLGYGAWSSVWGVLVTAVLACAIAAALKVVIRPRYHRDDVRETLAWAGVVGPAAVIGLMVMNTDYLVVSRVLGQSQNGIYSLAFRIAYMPLIMVGAVVVGVAFQVFAELHRRDDVRGLNRAVVEFTSVATMIIIGMYAIIFAMADHLDLLGTKWAPSVGPMRILCVYGCLVSVSMLALDALRAAGEKGVYLVSQMVQMVVLVSAVILLTIHDGIRGTAWAQVIAAAALLCYCLVMLHRKMHIRILRMGFAVIGPATGALLVVVSYLYVDAHLPHTGPSLLAAIVQGVCYVTIYLLGVALVDHHLLSRCLDVVRRRG